MLKKKFTVKDYLYLGVIFIFASYLISIFLINLTGRVWSNYDIYSDAILAKYMWQDKTLFPDGWYFGNQIYVVATPVAAALFYGIVGDAYLALALASCFMTIGVVLSYIWCVKPFINVKSILVSLLVVIGGTNIGFTAHGDWAGFQIFYTMASYYACYIIGIFLTLGVVFRLANHSKVPIAVQACVLIYNLALGMQSLREMLVLNLPLCATVFLNIILHYKDLKKHLQEKKNSYIFVFLALLSNICGLFITKILTANGIVKQSTIVSGVNSDIWYNFKIAARSILEYIGFNVPATSKDLLELIGGIFSVGIVLLSLISIFREYKKDKKISVMGYAILFFVISLLAVFCAGLVVIRVRDIYYFCWYFLVAVSTAKLMEETWEKNQKWLEWLKYFLMAGLIVISICNYDFTFVQTYKWLPDSNQLYQNIVNQLQEDEIRYLYSDWRTERNEISAMSFDEIQYGTLEFSGNPEDLWLDLECLYHEDWFNPENFEHAYIVLSDYAIYCLYAEFSQEYAKVFMDNLEHVYSIQADGEELNFYIGSDKMYMDMIR